MFYSFVFFSLCFCTCRSQSLSFYCALSLLYSSYLLLSHILFTFLPHPFSIFFCFFFFFKLFHYFFLESIATEMGRYFMNLLPVVRRWCWRREEIKTDRLLRGLAWVRWRRVINGYYSFLGLVFHMPPVCAHSHEGQNQTTTNLQPHKYRSRCFRRTTYCEDSQIHCSGFNTFRQGEKKLRGNPESKSRYSKKNQKDTHGTQCCQLCQSSGAQCFYFLLHTNMCS